jgi:hypothetical protein
MVGEDESLGGAVADCYRDLVAASLDRLARRPEHVAPLPRPLNDRRVGHALTSM